VKRPIDRNVQKIAEWERDSLNEMNKLFCSGPLAHGEIGALWHSRKDAKKAYDLVGEDVAPGDHRDEEDLGGRSGALCKAACF